MNERCFKMWMWIRCVCIRILWTMWNLEYLHNIQDNGAVRTRTDKQLDKKLYFVCNIRYEYLNTVLWTHYYEVTDTNPMRIQLFSDDWKILDVIDAQWMKNNRSIYIVKPAWWNLNLHLNESALNAIQFSLESIALSLMEIYC